MKSPYGNPLLCKLIKQYNSKEKFEHRYPVWVDNASPEDMDY